jgi:hypothetical protein
MERDDFDVLADGAVVGRIFNINAAPAGSPWMWTLIFPNPASGGHGGVRQELATRMIFQAARMSFLQSCSWRPSISQRTCLASYKSISASTQRPCVAARFIWRRNRASRASSKSSRRSTLFATLTFMHVPLSLLRPRKLLRTASMMGSGMCRHFGERSRPRHRPPLGIFR